MTVLLFEAKILPKGYLDCNDPDVRVLILILFKSAMVAFGISMETLLPTVLAVLLSLLDSLICFTIIEHWSLKSPVHESETGLH